MSKLRKSAKDRECQIRLPGICNFNPATTVLAHLGGSGMGQKRSDLHGSFACSACHDAVDSRVRVGISNEQLELWHLHGMVRTQEIWEREGLIKI